MQRTSSTIADVLPALTICISKLARMKNLSIRYLRLCDNLVKFYKHKFNYEIHSPIYNVAALFNVAKHKHWIKRRDCVYIYDKGCDDIVSAAIEFLNRKNLTSSASTLSSVSTSHSAKDSLDGFYEEDDITDSTITSQLL